MNTWNMQPLALLTVLVPVRLMDAIAGGVADTYTPQLAGVVPDDATSAISVMDGVVELHVQAFAAWRPNTAIIKLSALVGVAAVVMKDKLAVAPCATAVFPTMGVAGSNSRMAMTHPAHFWAVPIVQVNTSPSTATFLTTSRLKTVPSATLLTEVDPDGRVAGTVPVLPHATPMRRSPVTNPAGMGGENVVAVADPELPEPVDRTCAVKTIRRSRTTRLRWIPRRCSTRLRYLL